MSSSERESYARNKARVQELEQRADTIRRLNDDLRTSLTGGRVMLTSGVSAMGAVFVTATLSQMRAFSAFNDGNDPHGEHDFGSIEINGERVLWKIDYYDKSLEFGSPDPASADATARVLTIMLASEY
jgi:hypothetical protein